MKKLLILLLLAHQLVFGRDLQWKNIPTDVDASFRGLSVVDDKIAWVSGTNGQVGRSTDGGNTWVFVQVKGFEKMDFRSLYAFSAQTAIVANAGSPAYILRTTDSGANWEVVYTNKDSAAFFDGMDFWNKKEGVIYGDPIDGHMLLLRTTDGGLSWKEFSKTSRPLLEKGEASFAASGTNIHCLHGNKLVIATGGSVSRLFISEDRGMHWLVRNTPILQGQASTGIFSIAYLNDTEAVIVGGDYKNDSLATDNVFYTVDNGTTWKKPLIGTRGYRECAAYLDATTIIAMGPAGADISGNRDGTTWRPLSDEKGLHVVIKSRTGDLIIAAGSKGKISLLQFKKVLPQRK